jgi:hypothetical protein
LSQEVDSNTDRNQYDHNDGVKHCPALRFGRLRWFGCLFQLFH